MESSDNIKERFETLGLDILNHISHIANSTLDLKERLKAIAKVIAEKSGKDTCCIFLLNKDDETLVLRESWGLSPESIDKTRFPIGEGIVGLVAKEKSPIAIEDTLSDPRFKNVPDSSMRQYRSILSVPISTGNDIIGVINIRSISQWSFLPEEITLYTTIANEIAGIIRHAQLYYNVDQRLQELTVIYNIGQALTSTLDLDTLLEMIIKNSVNVIKAKGGVIRLLEENTHQLKMRSFCGPEEDIYKVVTELNIGEGISGRVAETVKPILIQDINKEPSFLHISKLAFSSILCVPLISKSKVIGTISLYDKREDEEIKASRFTPKDLQLLSTLANYASIAVENAIIYKRLEGLAEDNRKRLISLSILYDVSRAMKTTLELDKVLRIILAGVTMGGVGLGFNRAILLLVDEESNSLQGMLGVGPDSPEEAGIIWGRLANVKKITRWIITERDLTEPKESKFDKLAKELNIPMSDTENIFVQTVLQKIPFNITNYREESGVTPVLHQIYKDINFATAPLIARDKVRAVIGVDNMYNKKPITDEDIDFLMMLSNEGGLTIENAIIHSRLEEANKELRETQERLIQSEKMGALGEMVGSVAHEIRTPLISISGFAHRIIEKLPDDPQLKKYGNIICVQVDHLEKLLQEILVFSKDFGFQFEKINLNKFIEGIIPLHKEVLSLKEITVQLSLMQDIPPIMIDHRQMKQVIINIISNAEDAMEKDGGGELSVATRLSEPKKEACIEITNTGDGISPEIIANIFNPFFTTKPRGTGLGLAIAHRIVAKHNGVIEVKNVPSKGVSFIVRLPVTTQAKDLIP